MLLKAINPKNQSKVNKALNWLIKHNNFNDKRDLAGGNDNEKDFNKFDKLCINSFDKFLEYMEELPKREQKNIYKSEFY